MSPEDDDEHEAELLPRGKPLYSIDEAAKVLGVHRTTLYRHVRAHRLHLTKIGGRTVIRRADLEHLIRLGDEA